MSNKLLVSVIGGNSPSTKASKLAYEVGSELAKEGAIVICGGLSGVMEEVCHGSKDHGGITVGILPGDDPSSANPYVDIPIATGLGQVRNAIVARAGEAVIAIDGSYGTLSEIAHALAYGVPVIGLETWIVKLDDSPDAGIICANDPVEAVQRAVSLARRKGLR